MTRAVPWLCLGATVACFLLWLMGGSKVALVLSLVGVLFTLSAALLARGPRQ